MSKNMIVVRVFDHILDKGALLEFHPNQVNWESLREACEITHKFKLVISFDGYNRWNSSWLFDFINHMYSINVISLQPAEDAEIEFKHSNVPTIVEVVSKAISWFTTHQTERIIRLVNSAHIMDNVTRYVQDLSPTDFASGKDLSLSLFVDTVIRVGNERSQDEQTNVVVCKPEQHYINNKRFVLMVMFGSNDYIDIKRPVDVFLLTSNNIGFVSLDKILGRHSENSGMPNYEAYVELQRRVTEKYTDSVS
jgi:hypothetical protein